MSSDLMDLPMTDPFDEQLAYRSKADLTLIGDLVVWHQVPRLSARRLIQFHSQGWPVWSPSNIARIAAARTLDDTRDWYFPLITSDWARKPEEIVPSEGCWMWSGIWHETAHHASIDRALSLPPMIYLRKDWSYVSFRPCNIIASAGGLLLISTMIRREIMPRRRSARLRKVRDNPDVTDTSAPDWNPTTRSDHRESWPPKNFTSLLVCNPLTKEYRRLPEVDCEEMKWESWPLVGGHDLQALMVVDEEANNYRVIVLLESFVAVYKSTSNTWTCVRFQEGRPWSPRYNWPAYHTATAHVGGRLYLADLRSFPHLRDRVRRPEYASVPMRAATLRLFDLDAEDGSWRLLHEYTVRKFHIPTKELPPNDHDFHIVDNVELVGCVGNLFAIVPARLYDVLTVGHSQSQRWVKKLYKVGRSPKQPRNQNSCQCSELHDPMLAVYMPLVFYVMQLGEGDWVDHGVLRIRAPQIHDKEDLYRHLVRCKRMSNRTDRTRPGACSWFSCEARGSVIWVSFEDYLLSYDVLSGKSAAHMVPLVKVEGSTKVVTRFAYRPSFHMKP